MAYIGAQPNKTLTKTTSQSFNGTGSATTFTLNRAVNTEEELEVFVENVQQEPGSGKSYTATGTTLTFDEAPPSGTGNIYVIYRGSAEVTTRLEHDANAALAATTGAFSGAVTVANGLTVDDDGATVLTVDRATSDGTVIDVQKDGATIGSIGTVSSDINIFSTTANHTGLRFALNSVLPTNASGAVVDGAVDLGKSSANYRFRDLYLSGGMYVGGTASANHLDDYEEGEFDITTARSGTSGTDVRPTVTGQYLKIGRMVFIDFTQKNSTAPYTRNGDSGYSSGQSLTITSNLPFTPASSNSERLGHGRTLNDVDSLAVGWRNGSTVIYLGTCDDNNYVKHNNATTSNNQSNVTVQAQFCYFTLS